MKTMNIDKLVGFPFPTPPDVESVKAAIQVCYLINFIYLYIMVDINITLTRLSSTSRHWTIKRKLQN